MKKLLITLSLLFLFACSKNISLVIKYPGSWAGVITTDSNVVKSINGFGDTIIDLGRAQFVSAMIQKQDKSMNNLTVQINSKWGKAYIIRKDGIDAEGSTKTPYGTVNINYNFTE